MNPEYLFEVVAEAEWADLNHRIPLLGARNELRLYYVGGQLNPDNGTVTVYYVNGRDLPISVADAQQNGAKQLSLR